MKYISICSGIEAATVAWEPLGWEPVAFAEIDPFPCAVLKHHWPDVPNLGDITKVDWRQYADSVELVVGGTPCQSFSVAGKREGLDGASGLVREYFRLLHEVRPRWFVWENVPGCLSSDGGKDFRFILRQWDELGYHVAWRMLDAQYFGVPQRRRRVFAVGHSGDWRYPAKVLFEPESLSGNSPPRREARQEVTENAGTLSANGGGTARPAGNANELDFCVSVAPKTSKALIGSCDGNIKVPDRQTFVGVMPIDSTPDGIAGTVSSKWAKGTGGPAGDECYNLVCVPRGRYAVRRLTPTECERLQGFPDGHTLIPYRGKPASECPDGPRYKALGNSMCVNVMRWIGERIQMVEAHKGE